MKKLHICGELTFIGAQPEGYSAEYEPCNVYEWEDLLGHIRERMGPDTERLVREKVEDLEDQVRIRQEEDEP